MTHLDNNMLEMYQDSKSMHKIDKRGLSKKPANKQLYQQLLLLILLLAASESIDKVSPGIKGVCS